MMLLVASRVLSNSQMDFERCTAVRFSSAQMTELKQLVYIPSTRCLETRESLSDVLTSVESSSELSIYVEQFTTVRSSQRRSRMVSTIILSTRLVVESLPFLKNNVREKKNF
jgi:hypothetical protein